MGWVRKGPEPTHECKRPWSKLHPAGSLWECDDCGTRYHISKRPGLSKRWRVDSYKSERERARIDEMHGIDRSEPSEGDAESEYALSVDKPMWDYPEKKPRRWSGSGY